jgi:hypothetical protein
MAKPKKEEAKALAVVKPKSAAIAVLQDRPAHLAKREGQAPRGLEGFEQSDLTLPRLSLCQSGSPQRKKQNAKYIAGLEEGEFFNSITGTRYGTEVLFVPFFWYKSRIKFIDFEEGGGIDCQSFNGKTGGKHSPASCAECPFSQFQDDNAPECDLIYNYPGYVIHDGKLDTAVLSLKSTGIKVAKQFNSLMSLKGDDAFTYAYKITSAGASAKGNDFQTLTIANAGYTDTPTYEAAEKSFTALKGKKIEVDNTDGGDKARKSKGGTLDDENDI